MARVTKSLFHAKGMKETKIQYKLRGTTLIGAKQIAPTHLRRNNAYLCNGRTRSSLIAGAFSRLLREEL